MARIEKNENIEKKQLEIPLGNSVEEINLRKRSFWISIRNGNNKTRPKGNTMCR